MAALQRLFDDKLMTGQGKVIIHGKASTAKTAAKFGKSGSRKTEKVLAKLNRSLPVLLRMKQSEHITLPKRLDWQPHMYQQQLKIKTRQAAGAARLAAPKK